MYLRCAEVAPNKFEALMTGLAFDGEEAEIDGVAVVGAILGLAAIYPGCEVELIVPERFCDLLGSVDSDIAQIASSKEVTVVVSLADERQEEVALARLMGFPDHMRDGDPAHN